jgi:KaiC/GvpD/RAD55 family RecA-like ATPase
VNSVGKHLESARKYRDSGFSPIPISEPKNGTLLKTPYASVLPLVDGKPSWSMFQDRQATDEELERMWSNGAIVAVTCGKASGNLEVIDFDEPGYYEAWKALVDADLFGLLTVMQTPSGGYHVWYRTKDVPEGNQILARTREGKTAVETRGHGGYVLCAPSPGYKIEQGSPKKTPNIDDEQREDLINAARMLNQKQAQPRDYASSSNPTITRPGDRYARDHTWRAILEALGWTRSHSKGQNDYWTRPGKKRGVSASTNGEDGYLYVFTSNAPPFDPSTCYTKFGVYAETKFQGDFFAAAQYLSKENPKAREKREQYVADLNKPKNMFRSFADIVAEKVDWLWHPILPKGGLTALAGDPGIGKSTFAYVLASCVSNGHGGGGFPDMQPGKVLLYCLEDSSSKVIKNKLVDNGANFANILDGVYDQKANPDGIEPPMTLEKMQDIAQAAAQLDGLSLVVFDPISEWFPSGKSAISSTDAREVMKIFRYLAEELNVTVLVLMHPNKDKTSANLMYRVSGSMDFSAIVRSGLYAAKIPDTEDCAIFHYKANWGPIGKPIGYHIDETGRFFFTGFLEGNASSLLDQPTKEPSKKQVSACAEWIVDALRDGPVKSADLLDSAKSNGFSRRTMFRAKDELEGIIKVKKSGSAWEWTLVESHGYWTGNEQEVDPYADPY